MKRDQYAMVVDDNPGDIELCEITIEDSKHPMKVLGFTSGNDALGWLEAADERPAVIFLDLKMPGMMGMEFLRRAVEQGRLENVPVVVLTSTSDPVELDRARLHPNVIQCETKPLTVGVFHSLWLQIQQRSRAS